MPTNQPRRCASARPPSDRLRQPANSADVTTRLGRGLTARGQLSGVGRAHFSTGAFQMAPPGEQTETQMQARINTPETGVARTAAFDRGGQPHTTAAAGDSLSSLRLCDVLRGAVADSYAQEQPATSVWSPASCYTNPSIQGSRSLPTSIRLSRPDLCCAFLTGRAVGNRSGIFTPGGLRWQGTRCPIPRATLGTAASLESMASRLGARAASFHHEVN